MLSVNYRCIIVHYLKQLWGVFHDVVLSVLPEVTVGQIAYGRLHITEYVFTEAADGTSYPLMENYMLPVVYLPPIPCALNGVTYTHHLNNTYVTLFAGVAVMVLLFTQCLAMFMPFFS
jgi:hypothetical protein